MGRFKHAMQISINFKSVFSTRLRSSCGMCFGSKPAIVGHPPVDPDGTRIRRVIQVDEQKTTNNKENNFNIERAQLSNQQSDAIVDPVETVSLAFNFLKDETGSISTEYDGNVEYVPSQQTTKQPIYRFRPPQISAITKKLFSRNNNYDVSSGLSESNSSSRNDLDTHTNPSTHHHHHHQHQYRIQHGQRTHSETHLYHETEPLMHLSPHYGSRIINGGGAPISTNPLWTRTSSNTTGGSQPNLLSSSLADSSPCYYHFSPKMNSRIPSNSMQNNIYGSYPDNKSDLAVKQKENQSKRSAPVQQYRSNKKQITRSQDLDTNEFILRASNDQPLRNNQYQNRNISRDYRPHSVNVKDRKSVV